jgi:hypothetical protein
MRKCNFSRLIANNSTLVKFVPTDENFLARKYPTLAKGACHAVVRNNADTIHLNIALINEDLFCQRLNYVSSKQIENNAKENGNRQCR